ncbi:hypothetical protein HETIRDRAFT_460890 [Heterobasidion irregulare TC 32-1]|uniref:Mug135-like C-terminal domain-containing protein n=1 Tax=Heterobasidion irregulare (strain TC 32-1) TaxID=747525 RepID=W4JT82_HETIT|nr:uncharacterized protein HETIRDRAFT_460890 [Heterobasidion irregulare TC 32-1]ETW76748.1 hypothetical protein HETIRDRAFT_460890 [Heterobasidion irregulare TC 32-1]
MNGLQIELPPGNEFVASPQHQPSQPPDEGDICSAYKFKVDNWNSFTQKQISAAQCATAIKYEARIVAQATASVGSAPPWLAQVLAQALQPIQNEIQGLRNDMTTLRNDMTGRFNTIENKFADLSLRQADVQRVASKLWNQKMNLGVGDTFQEVPFIDGTSPTRNHDLPLLSSVQKVQDLNRDLSRRYHQGYFPGEPVPAPAPRVQAILEAIGVFEYSPE